MRTLLFSIAAAASALAFASPASAQYYPQPQPYGYGQGYGQGYGHGYNNPYAQRQVGVLMSRIDQLQRDAHQFDRQGRLSSRDAGRIHYQAEELRRLLMHASYNGLNRRERASFDNRLDRLRAHMRNEMRQYRGNDRRWGRNDHRYDRRDRWSDRRDWRGRR